MNEWALNFWLAYAKVFTQAKAKELSQEVIIDHHNHGIGYWMSKTVLFQAIQFSIKTQFSSVWLIDRTLSVPTSLSQSWPGSHGNKGILWILQSSSITRTSPSDCLVSYQDSRWWGSYSSEKHLVYSTAPVDWATKANELSHEVFWVIIDHVYRMIIMEWDIERSPMNSIFLSVQLKPWFKNRSNMAWQWIFLKHDIFIN